MATAEDRYADKSTEELFDLLRREVLAARLDVALRKGLGKPVDPYQKHLAEMPLPPVNTGQPKSVTVRPGATRSEESSTGGPNKPKQKSKTH